MTTRGFFETGLCHNQQQQQPALSFYLVMMFRESLQLFFCTKANQQSSQTCLHCFSGPQEPVS
jgi:hypothetical protein